MPLLLANRVSKQGIKTCWRTGFVPGGSVCTAKKWVRDGECNNYVGCFRSIGLTQMAMSHPQLDTAFCREYCLHHGYEYAAMRKGHQCACGNHLTKGKKYPQKTNPKLCKVARRGAAVVSRARARL